MPSISAVILAGGRSTRMNGQDKGLQRYQGKPLVAHIYQRLQAQVEQISINANRNFAQYQQFGVPVFQDELADFQGPLSGMLTALKQAQTDWVLFVPCDCPTVPLNLCQKLQTGGQKSQSFLTYVDDGERSHPTFCLIHRNLAPFLADYLASGERKMLPFMQQYGIAVDFSEQRDEFQNINRLEDLK